MEFGLMADGIAATMPRTLRVLVVDDLGFMRIALRQIIEADGDMRVVGEARNGEEAVALARELKPDVVTMDVEMPIMDGIEATRRIVGDVVPKPIVIMVSSHTQAGAAATLKALQSGAADFVSKESAFAKTDLGYIDAELRGKIRVLAQSWNEAAAPRVADAPARSNGGAAGGLARGPCIPSGLVDLVAIGVSTGGPATLGLLLRALGKISAPVVIAQHMPQFFTACFAESLARDTGLVVHEGEHRGALLPGEVTIVPGARDAVVAPRVGGGFELRLTQTGGSLHPSADLLFESVAMAARHPVAVILTGMGNDGTRGAGRFAQRNLPVLVQRPDSCVVGGMPSAAIEAGVASASLSLTEIARNLRVWASAGFHPRKAELAEP
ncbi:MAG TPA: chemotaxis-specific protein-glutamate methyltransferase CheB [Stellaceae bacterium]|nr:chemotaxis-specific protein-glutamate methyltransferase CheB [Stellaceae bacterium]